MKQSRFTEEQIIGILKEHETGMSVADLCRKHGVSDATVYKWKAKFGGMEVSEATRDCLALIADTSLSGVRVARELATIIERRGKPMMIISDNVLCAE